MSDTGAQYQINEPVKGIRFFNGTPLIGIDASLSIESNLSITIGRINTVSISLQSAESNVVFTARRMPQVQASMTSELDMQVTSTELLKLLSYMDGSVNVNSTGIKLGLLKSNLSSETSFSGTANQIFYSSSSLGASANLTSSGKKIVLAQANLSNLLSIYLVDLTIVNSLFPYPMSISSKVLIADIVRFTLGQRTPGSIVPLLLLDNQPLTDQNRKFDNSFKPVFVENKNWNNTKSRYYKRSNGGKTSFRISWDWLPSDRESTIDKRFARDYISEKAMDPDIHTLTVITYGENPEDVFEKTDYNVFISSYSENLIRRDLASEVYFWNCSLDLEEA